MVRANFPRRRAVDFVGDIRRVDVSGEHDALAAGMAGSMSLVNRMGPRYHANEGKRSRPTRSIPRPGFVVDTLNGVVRMEERKVGKGTRLREAWFGAQPGTTMPAGELLALFTFLNFLH